MLAKFNITQSSRKFYDINLLAIPCCCFTQIGNNATNSTTRHIMELIYMYVLHIFYSLTFLPF